MANIPKTLTVAPNDGRYPARIDVVVTEDTRGTAEVRRLLLSRDDAERLHAALTEYLYRSDGTQEVTF